MKALKIIGIVLGAGGWIAFGITLYLYLNSQKGGPFVFNWTAPTTTEHSNKPGCVDRDIEITGNQRDKFIDILATDGCNTGHRTMEIDVKTLFPKWTLKLGVIGGAGYMPEIKKYDALLGAEAELFRHYKAFAVGGGIWYMQGVTTEFKAGGIKADFMFSWGRQ